MTRITAIALLALLGSGTAAADEFEQAYQAHFYCAFDAAMQLVDADGTPEALARKAVGMCRPQEQELGWRARYVRASTETRLVGIISAERKVTPMFRGKARSRPAADMTPFAQSPHCANCGLMQRWDDQLKIWRPYP
jgi:hypothetical protein